MDFLSLILFAIAAIFSAYVCKQNMNLAEQLTAAENRLIDLESHRSQNSDILLALEARVSNAVKLAERSSSGQLSEIQAQVRNTLESHMPADVAELPAFKQQVDQQLRQLSADFKMHQNDIGILAKRQNELSTSALQVDGNVCIMAPSSGCSKGFERVGAFGTILHSPNNLVGKGFYVNGEYAKGWEWYHGSMCCRQSEAKGAKP